jgi:hypothetical protein
MGEAWAREDWTSFEKAGVNTVDTIFADLF